MPIIRNCNVEKINKPITYAQYKNGVNFLKKQQMTRTCLVHVIQHGALTQGQ
jgi:hypothetical protein